MSTLLSFPIVYFTLGAVILILLGCTLPCGVTACYSLFAHVLLGSIILYYFFPTAKRIFRRKRVTPYNKAVLITGCDSGFGYHFAQRLNSKGYHVFAGVLFPDGDGAESLKESCTSRLHVVGLDVTKDDSVRNALDFVKKHLDEAELWAVVNNAGVHQGFGVELSKMETFEACMNVNSLGPVRVTKAFLPLLKKSQGRVVTVASMAGRESLPYLTPYQMSKFAAVTFSESLRQEVEPWGIKVISVEPECFKTTMVRNVRSSFENLVQGLDQDALAEYGQAYFTDFKRSLDNITSALYTEKLDRPVNCLELAVSLEEPDDVYIPYSSTFSLVFYVLFRCLPQPLKVFLYNLGLTTMNVPTPHKTVKP